MVINDLPVTANDQFAIQQPGIPVLKKVKKIPPHRELLARRVSRPERGYVWTMGYNNVVGRYSGGADYSLFSGSSLNRKRKKLSFDEILRATTKHLLAVADALATKMRRFTGWNVSRPLIDLVLRQDADSEAEFSSWVSLSIRLPFPLDYELHVFSDRSRGKVKDKATAFFRACPGSRVFCTLTFIAKVSDAMGVELLNKFLTYVRKGHKGFQFLWVAERQYENTDYPGNIHFHLIMNKRLPVAQFNAVWVLQQYNAGLQGKNKYGEVISRSEIDRRYEDGTMQKILNPFDVKKIKSIGGLSSYLTKYITKQQKNAPFGCAVWHCSRGVSRLFTKAVVRPSAFRYALSLNNCRVDKKTGEVFEARPIKQPFFMMVYINNKAMPLPFLKEMEKINAWVIGGMKPDGIRQCNDELYSKYFCQN